MDLGISILRNLGLNEEKAEALKKEKPSTGIVFYERDQKGIGFRPNPQTFSFNADDTFARIAARVKADQPVAKLETHEVQNKYFLPNRMKKRAITSLSQEDLAIILNDPDASTNSPKFEKAEVVTDLQTGPMPEKRKHHRHHHAHDEPKLQNEQ